MRIGFLGEYLKSRGYVVEELNDFDAVQGIIERAEKPYLTPMSSPMHNDFTRDNVVWLVAWKDDSPAFLGCARYEGLAGEKLSDYWTRQFRRAYSSDGSPVINQFCERLDRLNPNRLAYFGDLYVSAMHRGSRLDIRAFVALGHLAVSLKWEPDLTYCFIRERDLLRGAGILYSFTDVISYPFRWIDPPHPRESSEHLAVLPRDEVMSITERVENAVRKFWVKEQETKNSAPVDRHLGQ